MKPKETMRELYSKLASHDLSDFVPAFDPSKTAHQRFSEILNNVYTVIREGSRDELVSFKDSLLQDQTIKKNWSLGPSDSDASFERDALRPIALAVRDFGLHAAESDLDSAMDECIRLWSNDTYEVDIFCSLHGGVFVACHRDFDLGYGWKVTNDKTAKKVLSKKESPIRSWDAYGSSHRPDSVIVKRFKVAKGELPDSFDIESQLSVVVMSLRMSGMSSIGCSGFIGLITEEYLPIQGYAMFVDMTPKLSIPYFGMKIATNELRDAYPDSFSEVSALCKHAKFTMDRLVAIQSRKYWDDYVVDLSIVLEGLLLPTDQSELRKTLAVRGAALLANVGDYESVEVFDQLKMLYKVRSNIVHGNVSHQKTKSKLKPSPDEALRTWFKIVHSIAMELGKRCKKSGQSLSFVIDELESGIVKNL